MSYRAQWVLMLLLFAATPGLGQVVYESTTHTGIYELLDELANEQLIELNDAVKPYSRVYIAEKLSEAREGAAEFSIRLTEEIDFYLRDYRLELNQQPNTNYQLLTTNYQLPNTNYQLPNTRRFTASPDPLAFSYRDSSFAISLRPVAGAGIAVNSNDTYLTAYGGLHAFGYWNRLFSVSFSWTGLYENLSLLKPTYFTRSSVFSHQSSVVGLKDDRQTDDCRLPASLLEWSASYSWKWGAISILRDSPEWGVNYAGANILSGNAPPFTQIRFQLRPVRWFEFTYFHGWLDSDVIDSTRSWWDGDEYHEVFRKKYIAANMFTVFPVHHLGISFGNSMLYSDNDVHLAYLVPFLFYKSVDHTLTSMNESAAQNAQMFFGISSRNIRHLHLHFTLFVDELSVKRIGNPDKHNFLSWKGGFRLSNWPLKDIALTSEYTRTLPMTFQHRVSTTTFENSSYQLGHYLGANSEEIYLALSSKPLRGLHLLLSYSFARHGDDFQYGFYEPSDGAPVLENTTWQRSAFGLRGSYEIVTRAGISLGITYSDTRGFDTGGHSGDDYLYKFGPSMFNGKVVTLLAGVWIR